MRRRYDHIDLRVRSLSEARRFYEALLLALGFTRDVRIELGKSGVRKSGVRVPFETSNDPSKWTLTPLYRLARFLARG